MMSDQRKREGGEGSIHVFTDGFGFLLSNTHLYTPPPATVAVVALMEFYQSGNPFRTLLHICACTKMYVQY